MSANKIVKKNTAKQPGFIKSSQFFFMIAILVLVGVTTTIYYKSLNNNFTNWDDEAYLISNPNIRTLHDTTLNYTLNQLFTSYVVGNYHPLTMLTYSMEYDAFELNPKPYHVTNLILHLLNSLLVLYFIWLLTKQKWTAFITALLFAVHPMHVESVSWISERKDLLYTFFSLATLCYYLKYLQNQKLKWLYYSVSFFLFLLAVLSKAMAVSVPLVFILLDYFSGKRFTLKAILDKIPFFIISIVCGLIALEAQKSSHAIHFSSFNFFERILFSCYGILMYLWKLLLPYNLSCYYNYPLKQNGMFPVVFYLAPFILIGLSWIIYKSMRNSKDVVFGFAFFLITIALVLQIIPVGGIIIADRYTYIPYIGIFFILARFINNLTDNKIVVLRKYKIPFILMFSVIIFSYCYAAFQRTQVWADSISLWTDAINKYDKYPLPYSLRGTAYYKRGQHENAISDFSNAISLNQGQANVYFQRGLCYLEIKKYNEAIRDFSSAIGIKPAYADAYYNRGVVYNDTGLFDEAIIDYSSAIKYNPGHSKAYYNRAGAYYMSHKYQLAYDDVLIAQKLGFEIMPGFIEAIKAALNQQAANSIRNL